jgi:iron complex transport system substrate-binding protein
MNLEAHIKLLNAAHLQIMDVRLHVLRAGQGEERWRLPASAYLYFAAGTAKVRMDDKLRTLKPYSVLHGGKGMQLDMVPECECYYYVILYKTTLPQRNRQKQLDSMQQESPFQAQYVIRANQPIYLLDKAKRIYAEWQKANDLNKLMAKALFYQWVYEIAGQLSRNEIRYIQPDLAAQAADYIQEHYREPITLEQLAELLDCSPRQLMRKFREVFHTSPIDYVIGLRLSKAKELLADSGMPLKTIAESVGYADSYYFSRLFKKHTGLSPASYREKNLRPDDPLFMSTSSIAHWGNSSYIDIGFDNHYQYRGEGDSSMYFRSKKMLTVLVICLTLVLSACGGGAGNQAAGTAASPSPAASQPEESTPADASRTIKHAMGETKLTGTPERVVILTNEGTEALLALGIKPVGAVQSWYQDPWYNHIAGDMKDVVVVGDELQPNIELIASLKPDLIIGNKVRQEKIYEQLDSLAPTIFSEDLAGDWKINFSLYSRAVNKEEEGKELMEAFDHRVEEAKAKLADKLDSKISIVRFTPSQVRIYLKQTFSGVLLDQLGFARPASQDKDDFIEVLTKETISSMDGDVMFYFVSETQEDNEASKVAQEWLEDPLFKNLEVSKNGKVIKVDEAIWNTAGGYEAANLLLDEILDYFEAK